MAYGLLHRGAAMTMRYLSAILLLGACIDSGGKTGGGGGGKGDDPNATFTDLKTDWELTVGYAGDAVVSQVKPGPSGSMFVTSAFPRWLRKVAADGKSDATWGKLYPDSTSQRSGYLDLTAHEVWQTANDHLVASVGDGLLYQMNSMLADGTPDPAFGNAGTALLPYSDGTPLRIAYDEEGARFLVAVARAWEVSGSFNKGPSKIEVLAYDATTGAVSSVGVWDMPSWANQGTHPAAVDELVVEPDGSIALVVSETLYTQDPSRADVATQWSTIQLASGQAPAVKHLAVTSYDADIAGFVDLGSGHFDLYLSGTVDGISMTYNEEKLVRLSVDDTLASELVVIGPGLDFTKGCPSSVATPDALVFGQSLDFTKPIQFTAYPKSGAPITFQSDLPRRCLTSLSLAPNGHIYAGTWDTTNTGWTALLSSLSPQ
jgi:hypothetical protein